MTEVYFIRHAQPDYSNHDDAARMPWCAHLTFDGSHFIRWEAAALSGLL